MQRRDNLTGIGDHRIPIHLLNGGELPPRGTDGPQPLTVHISQVKVAIHCLLRQQANTPFLAFETRQFVHALNRRERAVAVKKDQVEAHPSTRCWQSIFHGLLTFRIKGLTIIFIS